MIKKKKSPAVKKVKKDPLAADNSVEFYRVIFENSAIATAVIGTDGKFLLVNARFEQLSGYQRDEIEGKKSWTDLVAPDNVEKVTGYTTEMAKTDGQVPPSCSFCLITRNGKVLPMLLAIKRIPGTLQVIASLTENSVRKKLEEMLRATESRYRTLVNEAPVGVYRNKLENPGRFLWANPALVRMYGYDSLAELLKIPALSVYANPKDREWFIHELGMEGSVHDYEILQKKKDGSRFWVRISAKPKKNRDGKVEWIEGTVEDLTAERTEREMGGLKNRLASAAFDSLAGVGVCTTGPDGTITLMNPGMEQLTGYTADELVGKQTPLFFHYEPELIARSRHISEEEGHPVSGFEILSHPLELAGFDERECTYVHRDSRLIRVILTIAPLVADGGEQLGYILSAKEISETRRLEEAFRTSFLQMSGVIYNLPDATFAIDNEGKVIAWNRAMEYTTGVKAVDILGKGNYEYALTFYGSRRPMLIDLITECDDGIQEWGYCAIRRKGNAVVAETPTTDADNNSRIIWCLAAPIFDAGGDRVGAIESLADITKSRKHETALEESVLKLHEILDNTGAAMVIIEEDNTISYINPEFGRILGYVRDEIEGQK
ncbi:MAG: PAS domain S-box protein [Methanoregula sp.]|nr:PAS domain S-box protein [Methanoregula sp.]